MKKLTALLCVLTFVQAEVFDFTKSNNTIHFSLGELNFENIDNHVRIKDNNVGTLLNDGMPELPVYSTFYQIHDGIEYNVTYVINDSYILEGINIYPEQSVDKAILDNNFNKNLDFYLSNIPYPAKNLIVSDDMTMRDIKFMQISFVPFKYYPQLQQLEVFNDVDITVEQVGNANQTNEISISQSFENLYDSFLINYERDENPNYQQPAILYIGSSSAINNSYFQDLLQWRKEKGYIVYTATTSQTGTSTSSIKNYIQDAYDSWIPKPEFVTLIGDDGGSYSDIPTYFENWSGYNGEGDHPYSQLDGNDLMGDVLLGRISVRNTNELNVICNKIIHYEKATYISSTGTDWYEGAALVGDPSSSGMSTIITNEYIDETMTAYGFNDIRTKYSGSFGSWMQNELAAGVAYFNYRGYWGVSGFGNGNIDAANNGWKLPFASFITCGTGSFASDNACLSEYFLRAGTISNPKGAVAAISTATLGTHTAFNNAVDMGIYWGLFPMKAESVGLAVHYGKLHLYLTYPSDPNNRVSIFTHWHSLMGDPATNLWKDTPSNFNVDHLSVIPYGTNFATFSVTNDEGLSIKKARVTLLNDNETIFQTRLTDENGNVTFDLTNVSPGSITLTVTKQDFIPYQDNISLSDEVASINIDFSQVSYDQISGDNDGTINPGEIFDLVLPLKNFGSSDLNDISATLTSSSNSVNIITNNIEYGDINQQETINSNPFRIEILSSAIDLEELGLKLIISSNDIESWSGLIPVEVRGPFLIVDEINYSGDGLFNPGETVNVEVVLKNNGFKSIEDITGSITYEGGNFNISDGIGYWDIINPGESIASYDNFVIQSDDAIINGSVLTLDLGLVSDLGYDRIEPLPIQVGNVSQIEPLGPDNHGYYIFDSGDLGYDQAPFYDWIEIDPDLGGSGTSLNFNDSGDGNFSSSTSIVDLPFTFYFYGEPYNEVSVCTNGWIAFGESEMESFRNYSIPGAGGPLKMVAAFWDDLRTSNNGQVYYYYDPSNGYFIIEWSGMRTDYANSIETFQIILMDNGVPPFGDGEIKIQYKDFNNTSVGDYTQYTPVHGAYCTIGIENHLGNDGLQYTFNNVYPTAAMPLSSGDAILITTDSGQPILMGDVNQDEVLNILDVINMVNHIINFEGLDSLQQFLADVNEDGVINILDVISVINTILED
tara:strand:- start:1636 stop:5154 length:3519 start_codon:yes stop_codon:yes gene_type:complete